jgi:hypothetical protein
MYQPYNPYGFPQNLPQAIQNQMQIPKVHGREGANAFPMGPNSSALAMDEGASIVWMMVTDSAGYKTVTPFDVTPHEETKPATTNDLKSLLDTMKSFDERLTKLEGLENVSESNDGATVKTVTKSAKQ